MLFSPPGRLFMVLEIQSTGMKQLDVTLVLSKCTFPCSLEIVSVVLLAERDSMTAANNGTVSHYTIVHSFGVFQTSKVYVDQKKNSPR